MTQRVFSQRAHYHWTYVLPAEVLSGDPLDANGNEDTSSLRAVASAHGLCYASILRSFGEGLYWAQVASRPDLLCTQGYLVVLTEEQLIFALPRDCRLQEQSPVRIRAILCAHAATLQPLCRKEDVVSEPANAPEVVPLPQVPLQPMDEEIVVTTRDLEEAIDATSEGMIGTGRTSRIVQRIQHGLLSVTLHTIRTQLQRSSSEAQRTLLQTRYSLVTQVQQWHRRTRQRVINVHYAWCEERRQVLWHLLVGVPLAA